MYKKACFFDVLVAVAVVVAKAPYPGGGGGTAIYGLYRYVPLWRVWFLSSLL